MISFLYTDICPPKYVHSKEKLQKQYLARECCVNSGKKKKKIVKKAGKQVKQFKAIVLAIR